MVLLFDFPGIGTNDNLKRMMDHSNDPKRAASALAHYVDDSGTHGTSKFALMGGPVFVRDRIFLFHNSWEKTLALHKVSGPIHMIEFGQKDRLGYLTHDERRALFQDLVYLINNEKVYSLTVSVDNLEFQDFFPPSKYKNSFGVAPLAFLWCMFHNSLIIDSHLIGGRMAYVVAKSDFNATIADCHSFIQSYEMKRQKENTGSLTLDTPQNASALQAADMVVWANRRKNAGDLFDWGFEPLERLTRTVKSTVKPAIHAHFKVSSRSTKELARILGDPERRPGKRSPLLKPFL